MTIITTVTLMKGVAMISLSTTLERTVQKSELLLGLEQVLDSELYLE